MCLVVLYVICLPLFFPEWVLSHIAKTKLEIQIRAHLLYNYTCEPRVNQNLIKIRETVYIQVFRIQQAVNLYRLVKSGFWQYASFKNSVRVQYHY